MSYFLSRWDQIIVFDRDENCHPVTTEDWRKIPRDLVSALYNPCDHAWSTSYEAEIESLSPAARKARYEHVKEIRRTQIAAREAKGGRAAV